MQMEVAGVSVDRRVVGIRQKESGRQMIVSTKGRNALKLMMYLAQTDADVYTPLKIISARLDISLKYLENITSTLSKKKFVEAASGKGGGYRTEFVLPCFSQ